jgi:hypothetical protein
VPPFACFASVVGTLADPFVCAFWSCELTPFAFHCGSGINYPRLNQIITSGLDPINDRKFELPIIKFSKRLVLFLMDGSLYDQPTFCTFGMAQRDRLFFTTTWAEDHDFRKLTGRDAI